MSHVENGVIDGMIARDDHDHFKCCLFLRVLESQSFVVRTHKRKRMAKLSPLVDSNGSPFQDSPLFSFLLILRRFGSLSTLSVFFGIRMTGAIGVTLTSSPLPSSSRSVLLPSKYWQNQKAAQGNALRPLQQNGSCRQCQ